MGHPSFEGLERQLCRVVGEEAVAELVRAFTTRPVVLLGGDQATGKTTAARAVARALDGPAGSAGAIVRAEAVALGISFEAMHARLAGERDRDVRHDHLAAEAIAAGRVVVFEGRLAGHLCAWLRGLGRSELTSVYLACAPRERALRWLARSTSPALRREVEAHLVLPPDADFEASIAALAALDHPRVRELAETMASAASRDREDRARLRALYGFDYADTSVFDARLDTTTSEASATTLRILERVRAR